MSTPTVRTARLEDAGAVALVHVRAWQDAYRGQIPDDYLDSMDPERRAQWWKGALEHPPPRDPEVWVVERDGDVVGIASAGRVQHSTEDPPEGCGELWMINLVREAWGTGVGPALLRAAVEHLRAQGFRCAILWVLDTNARARRFYEREGWYADGASKTDDRGSFELNEVRYRTDF